MLDRHQIHSTTNLIERMYPLNRPESPQKWKKHAIFHKPQNMTKSQVTLWKAGKQQKIHLKRLICLFWPQKCILWPKVGSWKWPWIWLKCTGSGVISTLRYSGWQRWYQPWYQVDFPHFWRKTWNISAKWSSNTPILRGSSLYPPLSIWYQW